MRSSIRKFSSAVATLLVAGGVVACDDARATTEDDFARDLQLASSTVNLAMPPVDSALLGLENRPAAAPEPAPAVRRGAGTRAVRSETPTVRATPVAEIADAGEAEVTETIAAAPLEEEAPEEIAEPVAIAPRPATPVIPTGGDYGGSSGGIFGGGGGRGGVVIRGGGVDGDNCELHRSGGRRGPIYLPRPTASMPTMPATPTVERERVRPSGIGGLGGARSAGTRRTASAPAGGSTGRTMDRPTTRSRGRIGG